EQLHPALQHHIVNSLGWRELRPFQDAVIPPILAGEHLIVLAPTAGGKTEAAFFPVASRMLSEDWRGLSVLYLCPIKALLNNLDLRLQRYCTLLGRRAAKWHGDVTTGARRRILREPPDLLLTTPESLEVMLVSPNVDSRDLLSNLQVVIIDEIHAFAGDDRGWHLLSVLERAAKLAGREFQRIGLSATVGNPEMLVDWLAGNCTERSRRVFLPPKAAAAPADVKLDFVGSLENAATVIARLYRGEKRLVFIDSRAKAEQLGAELRQLNVTVFVTHSSLSQEQRQQAEDAFANRDDCVIVATSVLELGVDVGDLDRVIQIDSPSTVASFLQRMGRTGRRSGTTRNCLFLATREETLLQAAGLIELWASGFVEPVQPPTEPYHVLAQQLMALTLQESGIGRQTWLEWVRKVPAFSKMPRETVESVVTWMLEREILFEDQGILGIGRAGEEEYGRRHFMELLSVFLSPPLFAVLHGRQEIGFVDELTFFGKKDGPRVLLLGGRSWLVNHIDWSRKVAYVETTDGSGRSRWKGQGRGLSFNLCQSMKKLLLSGEAGNLWSNRAKEVMKQLGDDYAWLSADKPTTVVKTDGELTWWTFAGFCANASLAFALSELTESRVTPESFGLTFEPRISVNEVEQAIEALMRRDASILLPAIDEIALESLKFSECLPRELAIQILQRRLHDAKGISYALSSPPCFVST
ncbi:MAG: DEAD/DEAH box helicase, partial [Planctomycetota bacterium]